MKKIEIKDHLGKVLFTHECKDNTIKKTLEKAVAEDANLRGAYLRGANLRGAYLTDGDLRGAYLRGAYLTGAYLRGADLRGAYLTDANLRAAYLRGANLRGAYLTDANLRAAYLRGANLRGADLRGAYLTDGDLTGANLTGADLTGANLTDANLRGAYLRGAKNAEGAFALTTVAPEGELIGWKKCQNDVIVKLLIPKEAKRSNATSRKCRAEYVEVLAIESTTGKKLKEAVSKHDNSVIYRVGETVRCDKWDENRWNECSGGIHFFITKEEALAW